MLRNAAARALEQRLSDFDGLSATSCPFLDT